MACSERLVSKEVWYYVSLWENEPTFNLIYCLIYQFPGEFMASNSRFDSSSIQPDVYFVNYDPI